MVNEGHQHEARPSEPAVSPPGPPDDLLRSLNRLVLKLSEPESKEGNRLAWVNCPFVVTVIGGILVALVSLLWQARSSALTAQRTTSLDRYAQKQRILSSFANEYPAALGRLYRTKKKWITAYALGPKNPNRDKAARPATRPLAEEYVEAQRDFAEANEKYISNKLGSALCAEAKATFDSKQVTDALDGLIKTSNELFDLKNLADLDAFSQTVDKLHDCANQQYEAVVVEMGGELRSTKPN